MTDGVLATNRRGQIIMWNGSVTIECQPRWRCNTSILDLLSLGDDYDLRNDYWSTRVNHRFPRMKMENTQAFVYFALIRHSQVYLWSGSRLARPDRAGKRRERDVASLSPMSHELQLLLTSVILPGSPRWWRFVEAGGTRFCQVSLNEITAWCAWSESLETSDR